jgi:hypothetical protein
MVLAFHRHGGHRQQSHEDRRADQGQQGTLAPAPP